MSIEFQKTHKEKYSKSITKRVINSYYDKLYKNFDKEEIQSRIVDINIYIQLIEQNSKRPEYKIYIEPIRWLPSTYIKNPASFFILCIIHGFLPNIDSIIIKNADKKLNITQYKKFVLINRMLHLFFVKGFNFVLYDVIKRFLQDPFIKNLFEEKQIEPLSEPEVLSMVKLIEDIKHTWFDLNKHHFHEQLLHFKNNWIFSENMFLEVAMKYENKIREYMQYNATYIKPSSYHDDMNNKTDFNWIYSIDKFSNKYESIPIQFTVQKDENKIDAVIRKFARMKTNRFIYLQIDWDFKKNFQKNIKLYKNWILDVEKRESQDPTLFPLFINHEKSFTKELIVCYFYLHQIIKKRWSKKLPKLNINIDDIDLSKISTKFSKETKANWKVIQITYSLYEDNIFLWNIILLEKNNKKT